MTFRVGDKVRMMTPTEMGIAATDIVGEVIDTGRNSCRVKFDDKWIDEILLQKLPDPPEKGD